MLVNPFAHLLFRNVYLSPWFILELDCSFLLLSYNSSLYIQDTRPLSYIWFANMFSHSIGWLFTFLIMFFDSQKFLVLKKSNLQLPWWSGSWDFLPGWGTKTPHIKWHSWRKKKGPTYLFFFFSSVVHDFGVIAKNLLPNPRSWFTCFLIRVLWLQFLYSFHQSILS